MGGFNLNLRTMDSLSAELWSIWKGLEFAWNRGLRQVYQIPRRLSAVSKVVIRRAKFSNL